MKPLVPRVMDFSGLFSKARAKCTDLAVQLEAFAGAFRLPWTKGTGVWLHRFLYGPFGRKGTLIVVRVFFLLSTRRG